MTFNFGFQPLPGNEHKRDNSPLGNDLFASPMFGAEKKIVLSNLINGIL